MKNSDPFGAVKRKFVGDNNPSVMPAENPSVYGTATLEPQEPIEVRSFQSFKLIYTVGKLGLDDSGAICISWRFISDAGRPQTSDSSAQNFVTASSNGEGHLELKYDLNGGQRPWNETLRVFQRGGYLKEGEQITIVFGDTTGGSPGMLSQTFVEGGREFRVSADVQATGNFVELPDTQLSIPVVAGPSKSWHAVIPTLRRPNEIFHLGLKAEDKWGNPTSQATGLLRFESSVPVVGLPDQMEYAPKDRAISIENLSIVQEGILYIKIFLGTEQVAEAGPLVIKAGDVASFWGDLHGQTGEAVGTNTIESYLDFARNKAFLDVTSHQANDFQIKKEFWQHLNKQTAIYDEPGRFTVFPGYEWSGNTAVGGDHNVFFRHEGGTLHRCSHALLEDRSEMETDAHTLTDLYKALNDSKEDVVIYAHVGGRYANIFYDHDPLLETAVEMHSAWGTFEWILTDGFPLRRRVGIVCNSDGHKGRPGASYPGDSQFGAYGGLTCFLTDKNDRDSIFEAQRRRHHYGTTGCRMHMDVCVKLPEYGTLFERNPDAMPDTAFHKVHTAMMGDIVQTDAHTVEFSGEVRAHAGIERIEIRRGTEVLKVVKPYEDSDLGNRVRVIWSGAEYRGRGRNTNWSGRAQLKNASIDQFQTINQWNPDSLFEQRGSDTVIWKSVTTGNFSGFDAWFHGVNDGEASNLDLATNHGDLSVNLDSLGSNEIELDAGGLERKLRVFKLPDAPLDKYLAFSHSITLNPEGDNQLWICVTTEDGFQAWSSPIYLFKDAVH